MVFLKERVKMMKAWTVSIITIAAFGFGSWSWGQDQAKEDESEDHISGAITTLYKFTAVQDPLKMLEEIAAANEEILRKQAQCFAELDQLELKAKAAKASAARSQK